MSLNASYINNHGYLLFMCNNFNLCTEGMGGTHGLLSYMLCSSLYHGSLECAKFMGGVLNPFPKI